MNPDDIVDWLCLLFVLTAVWFLYFVVEGGWGPV